MALVLERRTSPGSAALGRWCTAGFSDDSPRDARSSRRVAFKLSVFTGIALLGALWGSVIAVAGLNALYLCVALIGCAFILLDFRLGVVLLILLMPISSSDVFPHAMLGITGLNPLNVLLAGTLGSYLLHGLSDGSLRRFLPRPLFWLYVAPILLAGALGSRHVGDIAPAFFMYDLLDFHDTAGYVLDRVVKPLLMVVFALLVGAAASKSEKPEKFLIPALISIWVMGSMVIVFVAQSGVAYALLLFTWAESKEFGIRLLLLASMGLVMAALVLTFSRGAFVGFVLVNLLFPLWRRNAKNLIFLGLLAAVALFA